MRADHNFVLFVRNRARHGGQQNFALTTRDELQEKSA